MIRVRIYDRKTSFIVAVINFIKSIDDIQFELRVNQNKVIYTVVKLNKQSYFYFDPIHERIEFEMVEG